MDRQSLAVESLVLASGQVTAAIAGLFCSFAAVLILTKCPRLLETWGGFNVLLSALGVVGIVMGGNVARSKFPGNNFKCGAGAGAANTYRHAAALSKIDDYDTSITLCGVILILGGSVTVLAGSLGAFASGQVCIAKSVDKVRNKFGLYASPIWLSLCMCIAVVVIVYTLLLGFDLNKDCAKRVCDPITFQCPERACLSTFSPVDTEAKLILCGSWCKHHHDFFCDDLQVKAFASAFIFLAIFLLTTPLSGCAVGAAWLCKTRFEKRVTPKYDPEQVKLGAAGGVAAYGQQWAVPAQPIADVRAEPPSRVLPIQDQRFTTPVQPFDAPGGDMIIVSGTATGTVERIPEEQAPVQNRPAPVQNIPAPVQNRPVPVQSRPAPQAIVQTKVPQATVQKIPAQQAWTTPVQEHTGGNFVRATTPPRIDTDVFA